MAALGMAGLGWADNRDAPAGWPTVVMAAVPVKDNSETHWAS